MNPSVRAVLPASLLGAGALLTIPRVVLGDSPAAALSLLLANVLLVAGTGLLLQRTYEGSGRLIALDLFILPITFAVVLWTPFVSELLRTEGHPVLRLAPPTLALVFAGTAVRLRSTRRGRAPTCTLLLGAAFFKVAAQATLAMVPSSPYGSILLLVSIVLVGAAAGSTQSMQNGELALLDESTLDRPETLHSVLAASPLAFSPAAVLLSLRLHDHPDVALLTAAIVVLPVLVLARTVVHSTQTRHRLARALIRERQGTHNLREAMAARELFLTATSHELRTPLTSILGFLISLESRWDSLTPSSRQQMLGRARVNAEHLATLLQDLLDISRFSRHEPPKARTEPTAMPTLVRSALDASGAPRSQVHVDVAGVSAEVDPQLVSRIVTNLVDNAVKYSPPGAVVQLKVDADKDLRIQVSDEGPGVPEQLQHRIFEPFERGAQTSDHSPGIGIGLALVRFFAAMHNGGTASMTNRPEGGSCFTVRLPVHTQPLTGQTTS